MPELPNGEPKIFSGETEAGAALAQKTPREGVCRHETCTASTASGFQGFLFLLQKPRKMRAAVIVLGLCVPGIAGAGANPDSTRWALGLSLPKMNGMSLWRVGPKVAHGITYDAGVRFLRVPFSTRREEDDHIVESSNNWGRDAQLSYLGLRFRHVRNNVAPFGYYGAGGRVHDFEGDLEFLSLSVQFGFGIAWKPLTSVDVYIRQGFYGYFGHHDKGQRHDRNRVLREYWSRTIFFTLGSHPVVTALFRF